MGPGGEGDQLSVARAALAEARWDEALAAFDAVLEQADLAEAHAGRGLAAWMLGDIDGGIASRARAFEGYVRERRCDEAARIATWVSHQYLLARRSSAARGWLARAERALEGVGPCAGHGWVAVERARHVSDLAECLEHAQRALAIARRHDASDLEVFALSVIGRAMVDGGRRQEGMELLEEAMAAASAGRVANLHTLAEAYCNLVMASAGAGDWDRATEWCEVVDEFASERGLVPLFGACRAVHADVLVATGRWPEAEEALRTALEAHERRIPEMGEPAIASLAELRVRQGRLGEAEELLAGREEHPAALRALALLRIAEGRPQVAAALLERGLMSTTGEPMRATQLLAPLVDARLACGDAAGAGEAAAHLAELAASTEMRVIAARADLAAARVALAVDAPDRAMQAASRALSSFGALAMPLESGEARLELARALAAETPDLAMEEARAALEAFRRLGASRAVDAASALLRDLGAGTAPRARVAGDLTSREAEVLQLLARGMSNAEIAQTLVISEKTAGHHVSRILGKLGVRNRAEAAAHAVRAEATVAAGAP